MKEESRKFYENLKTDEDSIQDSEDEYIDKIPVDEAEDWKKKNCFNNLMFLLKLEMKVYY